MTFDKPQIDRAYAISIVAAVAAVVFVLWGCLLILKPFLPAILLAVIFSLSAWPGYVWLRSKFSEKETLSALIMTLGLGLCFLAPLIFLGSSLADNFSRAMQIIVGAMKTDKEVIARIVGEIPGIGVYAENFWRVNSTNFEKILGAAGTVAAPVSQTILKAGATIGQGLVDISLGVVIAFFFFRHGGQVVRQVSAVTEKFAGPRARHLLTVSKNTMVSVVYGVLGTALIQGALTGVGLAIAGVPAPTFWGFTAFILSFIPVGPPLIWIPAAIWLYVQDQAAMSVFMLLWGFFIISGVDNFVRPYFIAMGTDLPILLVLMGVVGGILAFGFIGVFIGPTILAVGYALVKEWSIKSA